jgi:hypothetical protein
VMGMMDGGGTGICWGTDDGDGDDERLIEDNSSIPSTPCCTQPMQSSGRPTSAHWARSRHG